MRLRDLSRRTIVAASCLMLALPAGAQSGRAGGTAAGDGEPTPAACAAVGFDLSRGHDGLGRRRTSSRPAMAGMPTPPPPPPPPPMPSPPPPPVALRSAEAAQGLIATLPQVMPAPQPPANTERYPDATPNPVQRTADQPVSTFSIDVDTASYSNVRRFIDDGAAPPATPQPRR